MDWTGTTRREQGTCSPPVAARKLYRVRCGSPVRSCLHDEWRDDVTTGAMLFNCFLDHYGDVYLFDASTDYPEIIKVRARFVDVLNG